MAAPSGFIADLLERRFGEDLRRAVREETGDKDAAVVFRVDAGMVDDGAAAAAGVNARATAAVGSATGKSQEWLSAARTDAAGPAQGPAVSSERPMPPPPPAAPVPSWARLAAREGPSASRDRARGRRQSAWRRLDDFVVGASNRLAFTAAVRMAEAEGSAPFGPLFIHGECGVGKTHLLQGVMERLREVRPGSQARYTTGEEFTNAFVSSLQGGRVDAFRRSFRDVDLLCVDDVHFLANKTATQSELLHTLDAIAASGARVVLASDAHPRQAARFSDRLASRFVAGMVVQLERPDRATRAEIVRRLCSRRGMSIEAAAAQAVADRCAGTVRDLEGAVTRLEAVHRLLGGGEETVGLISVDQAMRAGEAAPKKPVPVRLIAERCAETLRVDLNDLLGRSRHRRVVLARTMAAFLARELTTQSFPEIARELNRPNHSTVVTAVGRMTRQIERDERVEPDGWGGAAPAATVRALYELLREDIARASVTTG